MAKQAQDLALIDGEREAIDRQQILLRGEERVRAEPLAQTNHTAARRVARIQRTLGLHSHVIVIARGQYRLTLGLGLAPQLQAPEGGLEEKPRRACAAGLAAEQIVKVPGQRHEYDAVHQQKVKALHRCCGW